jgi:2Fe-2S iron-sulfur cluster binding domain
VFEAGQVDSTRRQSRSSRGAAERCRPAGGLRLRPGGPAPPRWRRPGSFPGVTCFVSAHTRRVRLIVNGTDVEVDDRHETTPLLWVLRDVLGLSGTKFGCGAGFCAACTVLIDGRNEKSCQLAAGRTVGQQITTVEGVSSSPPSPGSRRCAASSKSLTRREHAERWTRSQVRDRTQRALKVERARTSKAPSSHRSSRAAPRRRGSRGDGTCTPTSTVRREQHDSARVADCCRTKQHRLQASA